MALLLILLALFGFVFAGIGSGSSPTGPTHSGTLKLPPSSAKCSKRMHAEPASSRCRPPASP